jgi:hypothetical protein
MLPSTAIAALLKYCLWGPALAVPQCEYSVALQCGPYCLLALRVGTASERPPPPPPPSRSTVVDMATGGRWEGKGVAVFYLELTLDLLHLLVYLAFFAVVFSTYGIPLHLVREQQCPLPPCGCPGLPGLLCLVFGASLHLMRSACRFSFSRPGPWRSSPCSSLAPPRPPCPTPAPCPPFPR